MSSVEPSQRDLTVEAASGIEARLLLDQPGREDAEAYRAGGGYQPVLDVEDLLTAVDVSGLRGRGGASFPTGRKLRTVRAAGGGPPVVVANGEEGEPTSIKDRWLLRHRPHLVLDGARLAAALVRSDTVYLYMSDLAAAASVRSAIAEAGDLGVQLHVTTVPSGYIAGEETAAVRVINGGPPKPTDKPPRPFEAGVDGRPTLVCNVETLANLPFIHHQGAERFREVGTDLAPGTFLLTLNGNIRRPGLYEVALGTQLGDLLDLVGGPAQEVTGALMGGYFAGMLGPHALDLPLDYDQLAAAGSGLGAGAVTILGSRDCPVDLAADLMAYFDRENADQCGSCFNGTAAMSAVLSALRSHAAEPSDVDRLRRWSQDLRGRGACATLDGATNIAASLLREFPDTITRHLDGTCSICAASPGGSAPGPFAVAYLNEKAR